MKSSRKIGIFFFACKGPGKRHFVVPEKFFSREIKFKVEGNGGK